MDKDAIRKLLANFIDNKDQPAGDPVAYIKNLIQMIQQQNMAASQPKPIGQRTDGSLIYAEPQENNFQVPSNLKKLITQYFGQKSGYDMFSGGVNYGVDFAVPTGTPVQLPEGRWKIVDAKGGIRTGGIGDKSNSGYGNSVYAQNVDTGEKIRLSHLSKIDAQPGQELQGGSRVGLSGRTGNASGPHLDVEYYDRQGRKSDVLRTPYAQQLFVNRG